MNVTEAHRAVVDALAMIAPDIASPAIDSADMDADLHDDLGLDSMDLLNLAAAISDATGVEIPDADYSSLRTVRSVQDYLVGHAAVG